MDADTRKTLDNDAYVEETARKYVKMKKPSHVRLRRSAALKFIRVHKKELASAST
jgi:hypothetical protein